MPVYQGHEKIHANISQPLKERLHAALSLVVGADMSPFDNEGWISQEIPVEIDNKGDVIEIKFSFPGQGLVDLISDGNESTLDSNCFYYAEYYGEEDTERQMKSVTVHSFPGCVVLADFYDEDLAESDTVVLSFALYDLPELEPEVVKEMCMRAVRSAYSDEIGSIEYALSASARDNASKSLIVLGEFWKSFITKKAEEIAHNNHSVRRARP